MNNICDICGHSFERTSACQKRHIGECASIAEFKRKKANRKRLSHLEKMRCRLKSGYDPIKKCVICRKTFEAISPKSITCSLECRNKNTFNLNRLRSTDNFGGNVKCSVCEQYFIRTHSTSKRCQKCLMVKNVSESYIACRLRMPLKNVPAPLIAAKRAQLQLKRLIEQLKTQKPRPK